jgi:hypothetical protein
MAEEFLGGRNMSSCVVGCSEPSVFAIQSYLRHFGPTVRVRNSTEASNPCTAKTPIFHDICAFAHYILCIRMLHLDLEIIK